MIAVTYKKINKEGLIYLPFKTLDAAKRQADRLYKKRAYLNIKVVKMEEKVLYIPGGK